MLGQRLDLERKLVDVHHSSEVLELVKADADQMASHITTTSDLAQSVSSKVRASSGARGGTPAAPRVSSARFQTASRQIAQMARARCKFSFPLRLCNLHLHPCAGLG